MVIGFQEEDSAGHPKVLAYLKHFTMCAATLPSSQPCFPGSNVPPAGRTTGLARWSARARL